MNREQYLALLIAYKQDKNNLAKYRRLFKYAYLLSDSIFKIVFAEDKTHEKLISLVNAMLGLEGGKAIREISLDMQEFPGVFDKKTCILDIIGTTESGEKVLVEVQQKGDYFFRDRVEYYVARVIENQVHKNEKYELPQIYFLGLLDFELFPEEPTEYIHLVQETCHGKPFFPKIQKVFVELSKFFALEKEGVTIEDNDAAAEWLRAIRSIVQEEPMPERLLKNQVFLDLQNALLLSNFTDELFNVEVHQMTDLKYEHEVGFAEGRDNGLLEGLKIGREEGIVAGREEGIKSKAKEMAKKLLAQGVSLSIIAESSGLSEDEIKSL